MEKKACLKKRKKKREVEKVSNAKAKFEVFESEAVPEWFFRLKAPNGKIICQSEGYIRQRNAEKGIESIKKYAAKAKVVILG